MSADRDSLPDQGGPSGLSAIPFGTEKTAEDWVETAGWWITELGDALPEASPMFKALVDVLKECQRRGVEREQLRELDRRHDAFVRDLAAAFQQHGVDALLPWDEAIDSLAIERDRLRAENKHLREAAIGTSSAGGFYCKLCESPGWSRRESIIHDAECPMPPPESPLPADEQEAQV